MVRHFVCWTLKEEARANKAALAAELREKFHALLGVVDGPDGD